MFKCSLQKLTCTVAFKRNNRHKCVKKFWIHLENQSEDSIAKHCLQMSKNLADKNKKSIMLKVTDLCKKIKSKYMKVN